MRCLNEDAQFLRLPAQPPSRGGLKSPSSARFIHFLTTQILSLALTPEVHPAAIPAFCCEGGALQHLLLVQERIPMDWSLLWASEHGLESRTQDVIKAIVASFWTFIAIPKIRIYREPIFLLLSLDLLSLIEASWFWKQCFSYGILSKGDLIRHCLISTLEHEVTALYRCLVGSTASCSSCQNTK